MSPHASRSDIAHLARLYEANGYVAEAKICWQVLHRLEPNEAHWTYYLAGDAELVSDNDAQTRWLQETVKLAPDYTPAWLALGQLAFTRGRFTQSADAFNERLKRMPDDPYAELGLARIALAEGNRLQSRTQLELLVRSHPAFASARNLLAEILDQEGNETDALQQRWEGTVAGRFRAPDDPWKNELKSDCYDAEQFIVWGETDYLTKHGDLGRGALERAMTLTPQSPRACEMLSRFYLDVGEAAKARDLLERHAELVAGSESLTAALSEAYMALDQTESALSTAERGLAKFPDSANLYNARGLAFASAGNLDSAIAAYKQAIARAPSTSSAPANLGLVFLLLGQKEKARAQLEQALRLQPGYSKAVIALATLELEAGNLEAASSYILFYYQQSPGSPTARDLMTRYTIAIAVRATKLGHTAEAERAYREGITRVPESAELHGLLGLHYARNQQFPEAIASLETARRLRPDDPRVNRLLAQLYLQTGRAPEARELIANMKPVAQPSE
ncbi:MAG TPA: tetratricopeptide repeat protein [Opitutaceae bacterium]